MELHPFRGGRQPLMQIGSAHAAVGSRYEGAQIVGRLALMNSLIFHSLIFRLTR